jgi:hypothetical protein
MKFPGQGRTFYDAGAAFWTLVEAISDGFRAILGDFGHF